MMRAERNGYFYVMDRANGQVLSATPFAYITASLGVDLKSGRLIPNQRYTDRYALTEALMPIVQKELVQLVSAGCREITVDSGKQQA